MENHWQQLWNGRTINFDELDARDERRLISELKRIVGWDFKGSHVDADEFRREYEYLKTNLRVDGGSVFEVGCGTGANLYFFRKDGFKVGGSDYAQNLLDVAEKVIGAENFVECIAGEASQLPTETKYDAVFAAAVFYYFPDTAYVEEVLNLMVAKAKSSVGLLRMLDAATEQDYLAYRRANTKNYDELYKDLPKLFLSKKFFEDYASRNSLTVAFPKHHMPGFWNEQFNFDCFLYKN